VHRCIGYNIILCCSSI